MLNNKKVVAVTGSSGYIGSRLLRYLEECGSYGLVAFDINPVSYTHLTLPTSDLV